MIADRRTQTVLALAVIGIGAVLYLFLSPPRIKLTPEADAGATGTPEKHDVRGTAKNAPAVQDDHDAAATTPVEELFPGNFELAKIQRRSYGSYKKNFVFPDGDQISITFKNIQNKRDSVLDLDDGVTGGFFERLSKPASEGNGAAAMRIYESLQVCSSQPKTEQELQETIRKLKAGGIADADSPSLEDRIAGFQKMYGRCKGVDSAMMQQSLTYLQKAADAGDTYSALTFGSSTIDQDPNLSAKYFEMAWEMGDANGAWGMARAYRNWEAMTHEDAVKAYAYEYVGYAVALAKSDGIQTGEIISRTREELISDMEARTLAVSPIIVEEAVPLAKRLILSNTACCD